MKRVWKEVSVSETENGFTVLLDQRGLKTPAKENLVVPAKPLAKAIAEEWDAVVEDIDPGQMPMTRYANSAIDRVAPHFDAVAEQVSSYGASDLLCYRAAHPPALIQHQQEHWDAPLVWAADQFGAHLMLAEGVMHIAQPETALDNLHEAVCKRDPFSLAGLHELTSISGSLILALAVEHGRMSVEEAWAASRLDENWQIEQWGEDELASKVAEKKRVEFLDAARFMALSQ